MKACLFFLLFSLSLEASVPIKEKIELLQKQLATQETSVGHYDLARAHLQDQEVEKAFRHYLKALQLVEKKPDYQAGEEEQKIYEEARALYLEKGSQDPEKAAQELIEKYQEFATAHPAYRLLNFLLATAYANTNNFVAFFPLFYDSFPYLADTFIAHKVQGILWLRLVQHGIDQSEKEEFQKNAIKHLRYALQRNAQDPNLYKVLIFLAKNDRKNHLVLSYLKMLIENEVLIPRADIYPYVKEAVDLEEYKLAETIIQRAQSLYEYSRSLTEAQSYLNKCKVDNAGSTIR